MMDILGVMRIPPNLMNWDNPVPVTTGIEVSPGRDVSPGWSGRDASPGRDVCPSREVCPGTERRQGFPKGTVNARIQQIERAEVV